MKELKGYITAREAAERLGYEYTHLTTLLKAGKIEGAVYWHGYAIPEDVDRSAIKAETRRRIKA